MTVPIGLENWELVALSGMFALGYLGVASVIGVTLAWLVYGEPSPAPVAAAGAAPARQHGPAGAPTYA